MSHPFLTFPLPIDTLQSGKLHRLWRHQTPRCDDVTTWRGCLVLCVCVYVSGCLCACVCEFKNRTLFKLKAPCAQAASSTMGTGIFTTSQPSLLRFSKVRLVWRRKEDAKKKTASQNSTVECFLDFWVKCVPYTCCILATGQFSLTLPLGPSTIIIFSSVSHHCRGENI